MRDILDLIVALAREIGAVLLDFWPVWLSLIFVLCIIAAMLPALR